MPATIDGAVRAKQIVESLGGRWSGSRGECRCPADYDRSPSLSVRLGSKAILFKCFAGCTSIDILKALDRQGLHDRAPIHVEPHAPARDLSGLARTFWQHGIPVDGTLAENYLHARSLHIQSPELRFNSQTIIGKGKDRRSLPAMMAAAKNEMGLVAVHRTFLDPTDILHRPWVGREDRKCPVRYPLVPAAGVGRAWRRALRPSWRPIPRQAYHRVRSAREGRQGLSGARGRTPGRQWAPDRRMAPISSR